jgi:hypothetical protein
MDDGPNLLDETTPRAAVLLDGRRDGWLEQRLTYLAGEQARLKASPPLRRFLRGAAAAYRRFLLTADPAHRFHCGATLQVVEPRDWMNSNAGERAIRSPDPHRMARTLDSHWRRA